MLRHENCQRFDQDKATPVSFAYHSKILMNEILAAVRPILSQIWSFKIRGTT